MMIKKQPRKKQTLLLAFLMAVLIFSLSACDVVRLVSDLIPAEMSGSQQVETVRQETAETVMPTSSPTLVPINFDEIIAWVQPEFDPEDDSPSARLLKDHIQAFVKENPGVKVQFRLKSAQGVNSILNALTVTAAAAPDALPTIVLLSRHDMESAAASGLIRPIDFYAPAFENNDWYPFSNKMGKYHGEIFGLPFAADVMVLALKNEKIPAEYIPLDPPPRQFGSIGFPAGNTQPLVPYLWYQSAGGRLADEHGQPQLDQEAVSALFSAIAANQRSGNFSSKLNGYQTQTMVWDAFLEGDLDSAVTWVSRIRSAPGQYSFTYIPAIGDAPYTYADGWVWCLVQKGTTDIDLNIAFMQHLVSPDFLQTWTAESPLLPVRPSSISFSGDDQLLIDQLLLSADLIPPDDVRRYSGAVLAEEIGALILGENSVEKGVQNVFDQLNGQQP